MNGFIVLLTERCRQLGRYKDFGSWKSRDRNRAVRKEGIVKKGYWVVAYRSISDESAGKAYAALALPAIQFFSGRILTASTNQVQVYEAGLQQRTIVVEFDSYDLRWQLTNASLRKGASGTRLGRGTRFRIVEGA